MAHVERKLLALTLLILFSSFAHASDIFGVSDTQCRQRAFDTYMIRGETAEGSNFPGARLWRLEKMNADVRANSGDACLTSIRSAAIFEAKEYWGHIAVTKGCGTRGEGVNVTLAAERPETCPEDLWARVQENFNFIGTVETGRAATRSESTVARGDGGRRETVVPAAAANLATVQAAVNPCQRFYEAPGSRDFIPTNLRLGAPEPQGMTAVAAGIGRCILGGGFAIGDVLRSIWGLGNQLFRLATDRDMRRGMQAAIGDLGSALMRDFGGTIQRLGSNFWNLITGVGGRFQCLNGQGVVREVCRLGANAVMTVLGGRAILSGISAGIARVSGAGRARLVAIESQVNTPLIGRPIIDAEFTVVRPGTSVIVRPPAAPAPPALPLIPPPSTDR